MAKWHNVLNKTSPEKITPPYFFVRISLVRDNFENVTRHSNFND